MTFDPSDIAKTAPLILCTVAGLLVLLLDAFSRVRLVGKDYHKSMPAETSEAYAVPVAGSRLYLMPLTVLFLFGTMLALAWQWEGAGTSSPIYRNMLVLDRFGLLISGICSLGALLGVMTAPAYLREHRMEFGEYYALILFSLAGVMILAMANDLVTVFLGVETLSLGVYVLTGSWRRSARSSEAAMKYFLVGSVVSAILLYGIALIYGTAGTTELAAIGQKARDGNTLLSQPLFFIGVMLVLASFAFKVAAVPFHMWAPDTYEGAPTPVTGFMMSAVKTAGFAGLIRLLMVALKSDAMTFGPTGWVPLMSWLAALSMTLGNVAALRQNNIKRLLAYSSVSHAGYLLLGVAALGVVGDEARGPLLFYLLAYTLTTVGSMAVVGWVSGGDVASERLQLDEWAGLAQRRPAAALAMTVFLLSLAGFPPTAGFFGKFYVFRAALMKPGLLWLVLVAIVNSVISVYYYLRVITAMYFKEPHGHKALAGESEPPHAASVALSVLLCGLLVLIVGMLPTWFAEITAAAGL